MVLVLDIVQLLVEATKTVELDEFVAQYCWHSIFRMSLSDTLVLSCHWLNVC